MRLRTLTLSILFTLFSFSTLSIECEGQKALASNTAKQTEEDIHKLRLINRALKISFTEPELKSCISNTYKLEQIMYYRKATSETIEFWKGVVASHYFQLDRIKDRYDSSINDCRHVDPVCASAEYHRKAYLKEYAEMEETKLEIEKEIQNAIKYEKDEEEHRKTFDTNCQLQKQFDIDLIDRVCAEHYGWDFPICRDYL